MSKSGRTTRVLKPSLGWRGSRTTGGVELQWQSSPPPLWLAVRTRQRPSCELRALGDMSATTCAVQRRNMRPAFMLLAIRVLI